MIPRKYPRTFHLPWSPGLKNDDKRIETLDDFYETNVDNYVLEIVPKEVVVTLKMDGENTSMHQDYIHARSPDSRHHPSRNWIKHHWSLIRYSLPKEFIFCGENLYAQHSIAYTGDMALSSYFQLFHIYNAADAVWLSWNEVQEWAALLDLHAVKEIYRGPFDPKAIQTIFDTHWANHEGYVVRVADRIKDQDFSTHVAKWVRKDHIQTDEHWMNQAVVANEIS